MRDEKKAKLLQYGERVWNISQGTEEERVDAIINATEKFYRSVGMKTKLSEHEALRIFSFSQWQSPDRCISIP